VEWFVALLEETRPTRSVSGCVGRRVSVGESKLCQMMVPLEVRRRRFPSFLSFTWSLEEERVAVSQITVPPASVKTRLPFFQSERKESLPLTGSSRLAIHKTVGSLERVKQTEKQKAFSPTWKKPAEKSPLDERRVSPFFSTESEKPSGSVSVAAYEVEMKRRRRKRRFICIALDSIRCMN